VFDEFDLHALRAVISVSPQAKLYHATDCVRARGVIVFTGGRPGSKELW